jgi:hypothetical protein
MLMPAIVPGDKPGLTEEGVSSGVVLSEDVADAGFVVASLKLAEMVEVCGGRDDAVTTDVSTGAGAVTTELFTASICDGSGVCAIVDVESSSGAGVLAGGALLAGAILSRGALTAIGIVLVTMRDMVSASAKLKIRERRIRYSIRLMQTPFDSLPKVAPLPQTPCCAASAPIYIY